jgi:dihydrofolate reductase
VDGIAEEPSDWFLDGGPEVFENLGRTIATQDDVLLGRATYDYWAGYWPGSTIEPFASLSTAYANMWSPRTSRPLCGGTARA